MKGYQILFNSVFFILLQLMLSPVCVNASEIVITNAGAENAVALVDKGCAAPILVDSSDAAVVSIVAEAFASDVSAVTGVKPMVCNFPATKGKALVIAGTLGSSKWIGLLVQNKKLDVAAIKGQWESFVIETVDAPFPGIGKAVVVVGSDRRGTAYGLFELSRMMGVSPWVWWADVKPRHQGALFVSPGRMVVGPPSVKYRGIFLNDEDWGLQPWAASKMDTTLHDIGPVAYAHVFELLLRLRANFIWPAMHGCTKAFYYYRQNPVVADRYAIVVGSSHCEPLLRNNVFEWKENFKNEYGHDHGEWRYDTNKDEIDRYWDDRVKASQHYESVYTVGMRGVHDSGMPGPDGTNEKTDLLGKVIEGQRTIFGKYFDDVTRVPQIFCPYKEVLSLYQNGLKLPDDVTIVWADDNHGYIRQLSTPEEQKRSGGSGVYYHISYWGAPHDYLWLSSISPSLISYEMTKAYQYGANRLWIVNVGDIKPAEAETQFFLELAWNVEKWQPADAYRYAKYWAEQTFGCELAAETGQIKNDYYELVQNAKPEHMRMLHFSNEVADDRLERFAQLTQKVDMLKPHVPEQLRGAFFELIEYPVKGAALMNQKILNASKSIEAAKVGDHKALEYAQKATDAFDQIKELTQFYNKKIEQGKWDGMMSYTPRNLPVYGMPPVATEEMLKDPKTIVDEDFSKSKYVNNIEAFSDRNLNKLGETTLLASEYTSVHEIEGEKILTMIGLGLGGHSISRYPFTGRSFSAEEYLRAPYVEYTVDLDAGEYQISVRCLPTQRIHNGRTVAYAISVNNSAPEFNNLDLPENSKEWGPSVIRGGSVGTTLFNIELQGRNSIQVYLLDPNLAVSKIDLKKVK